MLLEPNRKLRNTTIQSPGNTDGSQGTRAVCPAVLLIPLCSLAAGRQYMRSYSPYICKPFWTLLARRYLSPVPHLTLDVSCAPEKRLAAYRKLNPDIPCPGTSCTDTTRPSPGTGSCWRFGIRGSVFRFWCFGTAIRITFENGNVTWFCWGWDVWRNCRFENSTDRFMSEDANV